MTTHKHTSTTASSDVTTQAAEALAALKQLTAGLPIDDAIPDNQMDATKVTHRVPLEAMAIAASVLTENPAHFPQFDATDARGAMAYEQAMTPVAQAAQVLANRVTKSVLKRSSNMAHQTLALYQVMKGTSRLATNEETRTQVKQLSTLLTTFHKTRATSVPQTEVDAMVKTRKSAKKQALAQAKADAASNEAAIASAQAALDAAVAAGNPPARSRAGDYAALAPALARRRQRRPPARPVTDRQVETVAPGSACSLERAHVPCAHARGEAEWEPPPIPHPRGRRARNSASPRRRRPTPPARAA